MIFSIEDFLTKVSNDTSELVLPGGDMLINLEDFLFKGSKVFLGYGNGVRVRALSKLDEQTKGKVIIHVSDNIYSVSETFWWGLLSRSKVFKIELYISDDTNEAHKKSFNKVVNEIFS